MPVTLSIKDVPDDIAERLRARAKRHHRSLQGELMAIIESAAPAPKPRIDPLELLERARALGPESSSESAEIVRHMRDTRYGDGDPDR